MTEKERHIIEYLKSHDNGAYFIDIRDKVSLQFDDSDDFENTVNRLVRKNWIYENESGDTLYRLNTEMTKSKPFESELTDFKVLSNGADGGHHYISTEIEYEGKRRMLTALFLDKSDEQKLTIGQTLKVIGDLMDEGQEHSLMLLNTTIEEIKTTANNVYKK